MALASAPSTPERVVHPPGIRRAFTAPIKSSRSSATQIAEEAVGGSETLYAHTACKIVSFSNPRNLVRRHSSVRSGRDDFQDEPVGTLPWASSTERTIAVGALRIYKVLGTAFLNSGNILHAIFPKSQCWCVDGESKFVLRVRPNAYYRVELPTGTQKNQEQVEKLKVTLATVLQYEVTPCPFQRGFTVELPEPPRTPVQKRPWKPKPRLGATSEQPVEDLGYFGDPFENSVASPATQAGIAEAFAGPKKEVHERQSTPRSEMSSTESNETGHDSEATDDTAFSHAEMYERDLEEAFDELKTPTRPRELRTGRTVTAPPQLTLRTTPLSTSISDTEALPAQKLRSDSSSVASSLDSFHSFHSPISPLLPSPSYGPPSPITGSDVDIENPKTRSHTRDVSETTITATSSSIWDVADDISVTDQPMRDPLATPALTNGAASQDDEHWSEAATPSPEATIRRRKVQWTKRRDLSPLPPSVNLCSPYSPRSHMTGHHLTTAILQRTCSLLLGPPVQLVAMMLRIAAKIARGAFTGSSFGFGEGGQRIPCSWDFSDCSDVNDASWDEDDYGFSLGKTNSGKEVGAKEIGGSWEID